MDALYRTTFSKRPDLPDLPDISLRSTVQCDSFGNDQTWWAPDKLDITYCFGAFESEELKERTEAALRVASLAWERGGDVNFIQVDMSEDECGCLSEKDMCEAWTSRARYRVRQMKDGEGGIGFPGRATFPYGEISEVKFARLSMVERPP